MGVSAEASSRADQMWPTVRGHGVRIARLARKSARAQTSWDHCSAPATFRGVNVVVRPPLLRDAASWCAARLANQDRLQAAFGSYGPDWVHEQSELTWAQRCVGLRRAARAGLAFPAVMIAPNAALPHRFLGETGIDSIDLRTGTGELSVWAAAKVPSSRVVRWGTAATILRAFTGPQPLLRIVAPLAVPNRSPQASLHAVGFEPELTLTSHREYAGRPTDHRIFVLHNTKASRDHLQELVERAQRA